MKRLLQQILCFVMACIVLVTSTGFGLVEHSCMLRGKKLYFASQNEKCSLCKASHHTKQTDGKVVVKKTDCCQEKQQYRNVSFTASLTQLIAKFLKTITDLTIQGASVLAKWLVGLLFPLKQSVEFASVDYSPPHGRTLLALIQRFLL